MSYQHGERVLVSATFSRATEVRPNDSGGYKTWKLWVQRAHAPKLAVFLGTRALRDGVREWEEYGATFDPRGPAVRAALVSFDARTKPAYVPIDAVSPCIERSGGTDGV